MKYYKASADTLRAGRAGEGRGWEERCEKQASSLSSDHVLFHIAACATAATVCISDILTGTEEEQVFSISATVLFWPSCGKKCSKKLSEVIPV